MGRGRQDRLAGVIAQHMHVRVPRRHIGTLCSTISPSRFLYRLSFCRRYRMQLKLLLLTQLVATALCANTAPPSIWNYTYPWPVHYFSFTSQRANLSMAYMDVHSQNTTSNKTIVLLHGKNFCGATWEDTAHRLSAQGYRVIIPDQIGFCK